MKNFDSMFSLYKVCGPPVTADRKAADKVADAPLPRRAETIKRGAAIAAPRKGIMTFPEGTYSLFVTRYPR